MRSSSQHLDEDIARAWIRRFSDSRKRILMANDAHPQLQANERIEAETVWAFDALEHLVADEPDHAWRVILRILELGEKDEGVLDNLAAGPLESLLGRHGRIVIKWVEDEARRNQRFKHLLAGVWKNTMSELIWQRVERAAAD